MSKSRIYFITNRWILIKKRHSYIRYVRYVEVSGNIYVDNHRHLNHFHVLYILYLYIELLYIHKNANKKQHNNSNKISYLNNNNILLAKPDNMDTLPHEKHTIK